MYRTQKANGIAALATIAYHESLGETLPFYVFGSVEEITPDNMLKARDALGHRCTHGIFARPAPTKPAHGFVDSRPISGIDDVRALLAEAQSVDPDAELILMPQIRAQQSAILTPSMLSIGEGNDGATGGKPGTITLPVNFADGANLIGRGGITECAYLESVQDVEDYCSFASSSYVVQMRDGPAQRVFNSSYIARVDVTVETVLYADDDLVRFAETIKQCDPATTVLFLPGASPLSHHAVHADLHGVAVDFAATQPCVGQKYAANMQGESEGTLDACAQGISAGLRFAMADDRTTMLKQARGFVYGAATAAHQCQSMRTTDDGMRAIGVGVAMLLRLCVAACHGERRHKQKRRLSRSQVYENALLDYRNSRRTLRQAWNVFVTGNWSSSYGGKKWGDLAATAITLDACALRFVKKPSREAFNEMIAAYHTLLNAVHNGGRWVNKFCDPSFLDYAAAGSGSAIFSGGYALRPLVLAARNAEPKPWADRALKTTGVPKYSRAKVRSVLVQVRYIQSVLLGGANARVIVQAKRAGNQGNVIHESFNAPEDSYLVTWVKSLMPQALTRKSFNGTSMYLVCDDVLLTTPTLGAAEFTTTAPCPPEVAQVIGHLMQHEQQSINA